MSWLIITVLAYFFLAAASLFDRYFLAGPIPNPKVYTFNIAVLGFFVCLFIIPFGINLPIISLLILGLGTGLVRVLAILFLAKSIAKGEISRVVPAIGGLLPIFTFLLFYFFQPKSQGEIFDFSQIAAFILLILGSVLFSLKKNYADFFNFKNLKYIIIASFLWALTFFFSKTVFLKTNFLSGIFLILFGGGLGAIGFLLFPQSRKDIFCQKVTHKIPLLFLFGQTLAGLGVAFQYYAVFIAKSSQVPLINALEGTRYVFLLFFVFLLSLWKPYLLKEEMKGAVLFQKILAILLIGAGLALVAL